MAGCPRAAIALLWAFAAACTPQLETSGAASEQTVASVTLWPIDATNGHSVEYATATYRLAGDSEWRPIAQLPERDAWCLPANVVAPVEVRFEAETYEPAVALLDGSEGMTDRVVELVPNGQVRCEVQLDFGGEPLELATEDWIRIRFEPIHGVGNLLKMGFEEDADELLNAALQRVRDGASASDLTAKVKRYSKASLIVSAPGTYAPVLEALPEWSYAGEPLVVRAGVSAPQRLALERVAVNPVESVR